MKKQVTVEMTGLIWDSGYGETDVDLQADCIVDTETLEVEIQDPMSWRIDQDGGDHECYAYEDFYDEIEAQALSQCGLTRVLTNS